MVRINLSFLIYFYVTYLYMVCISIAQGGINDEESNKTNRVVHCHPLLVFS